MSKAIKELRRTEFDKPMAKEKEDEVIGNMGKLLDYFPIGEEKCKRYK